MSKLTILLIILCVIAGALVVAGVILNSKFGVIVASPKVSHDTLVTPKTRIQLAVDVPKLKSIVYKKFLATTPVPEGVLPYVLPYEAAVLVDSDFASDMKLSLFINDQRLAPIILQKLNEIKLPPPASQWFSAPMTAKDKGVLLKEGKAPVDATVVSALKALAWKDPNPAQPLKVEGGHLLETVIDNRDGGALMLLGSLAASQGVPVMKGLENSMVQGMLPNVYSVRVQADITPDNKLKVHLAIECNPDMVSIVQMGLEMGYPQARDRAALLGFPLEGKSAIKGSNVEGDYTISNFDKVLAMLG